MLGGVRENIFLHNMLSPGDGVLVGFSGGADSAALLTALLEFSDELKLGKITAVHVNHNLRGGGAAADENFVRKFCKDLGVQLVVLQADIKSTANEKKLGIEEAGRLTRYAFFEKTRAELNAQKIAVGHNRDDTAETVILNLCRGAGLRGLCGIPPLNGKIIRPLINTPRTEIEKFLQEKNITFIHDISNDSNDYTRNRVRHEVMRVLTENINPNAGEAIARSAALISADEEFIHAVSAEKFEWCKVKLLDSAYISLDISRLHTLPEAIKRRVIRIAIAEAKGGAGQDISFKHIASALALSCGHSGREAHLPGVIVRKEYDSLIFCGKTKNIITSNPAFSYPLKPESQMYVPELEKIIKITRAEPTKTANLYCTKQFRYDNLMMLKLRSRQKGDTITLGSTSTFTKKLQDYFTDSKIPASMRDSIPLLANGSEILWIFSTENFHEKDQTNTKYKPLAGETMWVALYCI